MELKLKFKVILLIICVFSTFITIDWYRNMDYVDLVKIDTSTPVSDNELVSIKAKGDYEVFLNEEYLWQSSKSVKRTKGDFPFVFHDELLGSEAPALIKNRR